MLKFRDSTKGGIIDPDIPFAKKISCKIFVSNRKTYMDKAL